MTVTKQGGKETNKKSPYLVEIYLSFILFLVSFSGCIQEEQDPGFQDLQP